MGIIGPTAPSGPAGGSLAGTYPNPTIATTPVVGQASVIGSSTSLAEAGEGLVTTATAGVARKTIFGFTGNGVKLAWEFNTFFNSGFLAVISIFQGKAGEGTKAAELLTAPVKGIKVKWKNEKELEITFTEAPAAKEPWFVCITT